MVKPLGYYTSVMPNDDSLLDEMQSAWGSTFEVLNNCQRCWMIQMLASKLQEEFYEDHDLDGDVEEMTERFDELSTGQKMGLIDALIHQIVVKTM